MRRAQSSLSMIASRCLAIIVEIRTLARLGEIGHFKFALICGSLIIYIMERKIDFVA